jgi:hypothetical protein
MLMLTDRSKPLPHPQLGAGFGWHGGGAGAQPPAFNAVFVFMVFSF